MAGDSIQGAGKLSRGHEAAIQSAFGEERVLIGAGGRLVGVRASGASVALPLGSAAGNERAGLVALAAQCAARLAVLASLPEGAQCRIIEYKVDYGGAIAVGEVTAEGAVVRPGGSITVARAHVRGVGTEGETMVAVLQATFLHDERKRPAR